MRTCVKENATDRREANPLFWDLVMLHVDIPAPWRALLEKLATENWQRLLVLGAPDRGKSTFCDVLLRLLHTQKTKAMLLDTALAEKTVGPPACLTLGQIAADHYALKDLYFVGGIVRSSRSNAMVN